MSRGRDLGRSTWPAAAALLVAWYLATRRGGEVLNVPTLLLWISLVAAAAIGYAAAWSARRRLQSLRFAAGTAGIGVGSGLVAVAAWSLGGASASQGAVAGVLGAALALAGVLLAAAPGSRPTPTLILAALAIAMWAVTNAASVQGGVHIVEGEVEVYVFFDFQVYLAAGRNFLADAPVYLAEPLAAIPRTIDEEPFLYTPVLLPLMAAMASVPRVLLAWLFAAVLVAAALLGLRLLGMSWRWALLLLAYPPMFKGILSGNVASLLFLAYAATPYLAAAPFAGALVKVQSVIPASWALRERRWRDAGLGCAIVLAAVLLTLPLVGVERWVEYVDGLRNREMTQQAVPALYGVSLAQLMPLAAFVGLSAAAVLIALIPGGRRSLILLGAATIVASPSLWPHGFAMALPGVLALPPPLMWLALGAFLGGWDSWFVVAAAVLSVVIGLRWRPSEDAGDPMAGRDGPWSGADGSLDRRERSGSDGGRRSGVDDDG